MKIHSEWILQIMWPVFNRNLTCFHSKIQILLAMPNKLKLSVSIVNPFQFYRNFLNISLRTYYYQRSRPPRASKVRCPVCSSASWAHSPAGSAPSTGLSLYSAVRTPARRLRRICPGKQIGVLIALSQSLHSINRAGSGLRSRRSLKCEFLMW